MESDKKLKIAVLCDWYLPGYKAGGPIQSVANLVASLDQDFDVITSDRDLGEQAAYSGIQTDQWTKGKSGERVIYLSPSSQVQSKFEEIFKDTNYDAIYLNSMFSPNFSITPMKVLRKLELADKVVLAPRGMLKSGALAQKGWKKKAFLFVAKTLGWYKDIRWHATNELEGTEIREIFGTCDIRIAPNLVSTNSESFSPTVKEKGSLKLITVARISPEKNILGAIEFLKELKVSQAKLTWEIYGTQNDPIYKQQCLQAISQISGAYISLKGEIEHHQIPALLKKNHLFYLPTLGENYGHSIVESFLSGTPVLISDKTPWRGLEEKKAGWDLPLDSGLFAETISSCIQMSQEGYDKWAQGAYNLGIEIAENTEARTANNNLFLR